ncbi:hypothetical protein DLM78_22230 [Leptospira stimsonii]|uniref:Lipoprotein n=1 Tax=Leptospira stimsonii TaxID=2202203 RepID=A0A8B3CMF3_9LEPT|nr:hypothetical protein DLM78_22230 [Leptospira stimsonii]
MRSQVHIIMSMFVIIMFASVSCEDETEYKDTPEERRTKLLVYFLDFTPWNQKSYINPCNDSSISNAVAINSPQSIIGSTQNFRFITGINGLKYSMTISSDYPSCGVRLEINNCKDLREYANNSIVTCNQGTFDQFISGGTQVCNIPSFKNQLVIISIYPNSINYPKTSCNTISFEVLP